MRLVTAVVLAVGVAACARPSPEEIEHRREPDSIALVEMLASGPAADRARAALAMGRIQSPFYADALAAAVDDTDPEVRHAAWFALGQLGLAEGAVPPPAAIEAARHGLLDPDPEVVAMAVEALGKLAPPGAAADLVPRLGHASAAVRAETAHALLRLRFVPTWRGEAKEPPPLPDSAVAALAEGLQDQDATVRQAAAHALSRYGEAAAASALAGLAADPEPWVRMFAVRGVGRSGAAEQAEAIAWGLSDADSHVRAEAVAAVALLGRADLITERLDGDGSFHVRAAVAAALGGVEGDGAVARLRALESDPSPTVQSAVIGALSKSLGTEYLPELRRHLTSDAWVVRAAAARATAAIDEEGIEVALEAAVDPDPRVRSAALDALRSNVDLTVVAEAVDAALGSNDIGERATAVEILVASERSDRLARLSEIYDRSSGVEWVEVRETIVEGVAELPDAADLLRRSTSDPAPSVRSKARAALLALGLEAPDVDKGVLDAMRIDHEPFDEDPIVVFDTSKGAIEIRLFAEDAPIHVSNMVRLVRDGFYDDTAWHRVVPNFVIQGGDPLGSGWGGPGYVVPDEINRRRFAPGTVGMPKAGKDTGGCQIFITHVPTPHLDGNYTVFGEVVSGMDVVDRIEIGDIIAHARVRH
jgi:cyclophilin family peptidyl-prolyl cis-trans isomerase/HEAT repeat protein